MNVLWPKAPFLTIGAWRHRYSKAPFLSVGGWRRRKDIFTNHQLMSESCLKNSPSYTGSIKYVLGGNFLQTSLFVIIKLLDQIFQPFKEQKWCQSIGFQRETIFCWAWGKYLMQPILAAIKKKKKCGRYLFLMLTKEYVFVLRNFLLLHKLKKEDDLTSASYLNNC